MSELSETSVESRGARGRAGHGQRRGPEPPQRAARRARPRRRPRPRRVTASPDRRPQARPPRHLTACHRAKSAGSSAVTQTPASRQQDEVVAVDDLVGHARGQVARVAAGDAAQLAGLDAAPCRGRTRRRRGRRPRRRRPRRTPRRRSTTPAGSRLVWRSTSARRAPSSTVDRAGDLSGEGDPQLAGRQRAAGGRRSVVPTPAHRRRRRPARRAARRRRSRCARPTTTRCGPPPASAPCPRCPARCRRPGADRQQRVVDARPRSTSVASGRRGGRRCTGPAMSVSSTSTSAAMLWATRAAMRSLSP